MNTAEALAEVPHGRPDKSMITIARKIIEQKEGDFDPEQFTDRYEDALRELIEEKKRGHKITVSEEPRDVGNVVDLMEALKRSIAGEKGSGKSNPKRSATVSKLPKRKG